MGASRKTKLLAARMPPVGHAIRAALPVSPLAGSVVGIGPCGDIHPSGATPGTRTGVDVAAGPELLGKGMVGADPLRQRTQVDVKIWRQAGGSAGLDGVVDEVTHTLYFSRDDEVHLMDRLMLTAGAAVPALLAVAVGSSIPDCGREAYALHVVGWFLIVLLVAGGSAFLTGLVVGWRRGPSAIAWASIACATAAAVAAGFMLGPVLGGCGLWWDAVAVGFIFVLVTALVAGGASLALSTAIRRHPDVEPKVDEG